MMLSKNLLISALSALVASTVVAYSPYQGLGGGMPYQPTFNSQQFRNPFLYRGTMGDFEEEHHESTCKCADVSEFKTIDQKFPSIQGGCGNVFDQEVTSPLQEISRGLAYSGGDNIHYDRIMNNRFDFKCGCCNDVILDYQRVLGFEKTATKCDFADPCSDDFPLCIEDSTSSGKDGFCGKLQTTTERVRGKVSAICNANIWEFAILSGNFQRISAAPGIKKSDIGKDFNLVLSCDHSKESHDYDEDDDEDEDDEDDYYYPRGPRFNRGVPFYGSNGFGTGNFNGNFYGSNNGAPTNGGFNNGFNTYNNNGDFNSGFPAYNGGGGFNNGFPTYR